jgi:VWFA-related protein
VRQRVDAASLADLPIDVVLALDVSGSVAGPRLTGLLDAARALVDALHDGDRAALVTFSHAVNVLTPLTAARADVRARLAEVRADGFTSMGDAAYVALTLPGDARRSTLSVLFSDGVDTMSWLSNAAVLDTARRSDAVVYVVSVGLGRSVDRELPSWMRPGAGDPDVALLANRREDAEFTRFLDDVATTTGGAVIELENRAPLRGAFLEVLDRFRARYQLTYTVSGVKTKGQHSIEVRVKRPGAKVRARPGYTR